VQIQSFGTAAAAFVAASAAALAAFWAIYGAFKRNFFSPKEYLQFAQMSSDFIESPRLSFLAFEGR
jgi:hypothetical protein